MVIMINSNCLEPMANSMAPYSRTCSFSYSRIGSQELLLKHRKWTPYRLVSGNDNIGVSKAVGNLLSSGRRIFI